MHKYKKMIQNKAAILPLSKPSPIFSFSFSIDTAGLSNIASDGNHYIVKDVDHFKIYNVTVPTPQINAHYPVDALFHHWISKSGPP